MIHKNLPHRARGVTQEVRTVTPIGLPPRKQPQIGFVHQRRRLQSVAQALLAHEAPGQATQLTVYRLSELRMSGFVTEPGSFEQTTDFSNFVRQSVFFSRRLSV